MKRHIFSFLFIIIPYVFFANELRIGNGVTSMQAAQNYDGSALILYVQNGSLKAINADESSRLQKIDLPEDISGITDVQGLCLCEVNSNFFVCIGKENDIYKLITIKIDYDNTIELKKHVLNFEKNDFSDFSLNYNDNTKVYNYTFLNNNALYNIAISDNEVNEISQISNQDDKVTSYMFYYWYEGDLIGYYLSTDNSKITFLKKTDNQFAKNDLPSYGVIEYADFFYTENKDLYVMLFAEGKTVLLKNKNNSFEEKEITLGYAYYPLLITNNSLSDKISFNDSTLTVKRSLLEDSYAAEEVKIISNDDDKVLVIYKTADGWRLLNITESNIDDVDLNLPVSVIFAKYVDEQIILFKDMNKKLFILSTVDYQKIKELNLDSINKGIKTLRNDNQRILISENESSLTLMSDDFDVLSKFNKDLFIITNSKNDKSKICIYYKGSLTVNNTEVIYE